MTVFKLEMELNKGVVVIVLNFHRDKYRGGDVFRVGDDTRVFVNDVTFECTTKLKEW